LNCHNVAKHFKFEARDIVVRKTATASASAVEIKMATLTGAEREETKSATQFRTQYDKEPPSRPTIYSWHENFVETG
jgi:hypothetical protein